MAGKNIVEDMVLFRDADQGWPDDALVQFVADLNIQNDSMSLHVSTQLRRNTQAVPRFRLFFNINQ